MLKRMICALLTCMLLLGGAADALADREEDQARLAVNLQAIKAALDRNELQYTYQEDGDSFYAEFDLDGAISSCIMWLIAYDDGVQIQMDYDMEIPPDRVDELARYLMRRYSSLRMGGFYIDYEEGFVGYQSFIYSDVLPPTQNALDFHMAMGLTMLERLSDRVKAILLDGMTAEEAWLADDAKN